MKEVIITHVNPSPSREYAQAPSLWVRGTLPVVVEGDGTLRAVGPGVYDFTTFFGSLSYQKLRRYTMARDFCLTLRIQGNAVIALTSASTFDFEPRLISGTEVSTELMPADQDGWREVRVVVPNQDYGPAWVIVGFTVCSEDPIALRDVCWQGLLDEGDVRDVELALCTTTYKKERYIMSNVRAVDEFVAGEPDFSRHFTMHVVDNGRTLNPADIDSPVVRLHCNPNVGGAGGFARGMIEALEQTPRATHVILMDDDVSIQPESLFRAYALLQIVAPAYEDAFIGGAMMDYNDPSLRFEDIGFMNSYGEPARIKPLMRMDILHDVVENEAFRPPVDVPECQDQHQRYQAWFFCCIPVAEIERRGMPLPLFVRFDDVEYSLRAGLDQKIMTLNGICVWHLPFFIRYDPVVAFYQVPRNLLLIKACSGVAPLSDFERYIRIVFERELWHFNYQGAELILEAIKDYLAGPSVSLAPGFAEQRFLETHAMWERLRPLEDMRSELEGLGIDAATLLADDIVSDVPRSEEECALDDKTFNGQRFSLKPYTIPDKVAVIDAAYGAFQPGVVRRAATVVAVDIPNGACEIRHRDPKRFSRDLKEFDRCMKACEERRDELALAYQVGSTEIRTIQGWKRHLGLDE